MGKIHKGTLQKSALSLSILLGFVLIWNFKLTPTDNQIFRLKWLVSKDSPDIFHQTALKFKATAEKLSDGQLKIEVHTEKSLSREYGIKKYFFQKNGSLDILKMLQAAEVELGQLYLYQLGELSPAIWTLDLPFLFPNTEQTGVELKDSIVISILSGLNKSGLIGISVLDIGDYYVFLNQAGPSVHLSDFENRPVRVNSSPIYQSLFAELGASVFPTSYRDISRLNEAGLLSTTVLTAYQFQKLSPHPHLKVSHFYEGKALTGIAINQEAFDQLPIHLQSVVRKSAEQLQSLPMTFPAPSFTSQLAPLDRENLISAVQKVRNRLSSFLDKSLLDRLSPQ